MQSLKQLATTTGTAVEHLPSGRAARITAWTVRFPPAFPDRLAPGTLAKTYTDKPLVSLEGEALFGELAVARCLVQDGWSAVWADTFHGQKFWTALPHLSEPVSLPAEVRALYDRIARIKGSASGCFDVIAWTEDRIVFLEYKGPNDRPNKNEPFWIDAALQAGVSEEDLFFVGDKARGSISPAQSHSSAAPPPRPEHRPSTRIAVPTAPVMESAPDSPEVEEFTSDAAYFDWLHSHPDAFVLSVRGKKIKLHRASCTHIDRHNNPGALTERGSKKMGAEQRQALARWSQQRGLSNGITVPRCPDCR